VTHGMHLFPFMYQTHHKSITAVGLTTTTVTMILIASECIRKLVNVAILYVDKRYSVLIAL